MPNVKISAAADAGTLLSSDMLPLARSGDTNAYHATMAEIATYTGASVSSGAYGNTGRNFIHNPMFSIAQRGTPVWTGSGYTLDRWEMEATADSFSVSQGTISDTQRAQIGDESAEFCLGNTFAGTAGSGSSTVALQHVEDVRRLSGKTVTVSFWAVASAALKLGVSPSQYFGTGGSPSATVNVNGQSVTLATTYARYTLTFTLPSAAGKTLGTNNDHTTVFYFWYSAGSGNATQSGNVGVQSGSINLWGVQVETGSVATPLDHGGSLQQQLANCQRYYQFGYIFDGFYQNGGGACVASQMTQVPMRAAPSVTVLSNANTNISGFTATYSGGAVVAQGTATASGGGVFDFTYALSADL